MITIQRYPKSIYFYCAVSTGCEKLTGLPDLEPLRERLDVLLKDQFCVSFTTFADLCLLNICRMNKSVVFGLWINNDPHIFVLEKAEAYKTKGNDEYGKKNFINAIRLYTKGIQVNCKDKELNAKLYSNRATAHFYLGRST